MRKRITEKDCQRAMELAAAAVGKPWERDGNVYEGSPYADNLTPVGKLWHREGDRNVAYVGAWHLSGAYGGLCVHEIVNPGGGVRTPVAYAHIPKRDLFDKLQSFRMGAEADQAREEAQRDAFGYAEEEAEDMRARLRQGRP